MKWIRTINLLGIGFLVLFPITLLAQEVSVSGTVTDTDGEALPGVNVLIDESGSGTITNTEGEYRLEAPSDGTLVFSFIGFDPQRVAIEGQTTIDVVMQESTAELDELVVMGCSERGLREISSSVVSVDAEDLQDVTTSNTTSLLQGKASGVYMSSTSGSPGSTPEVRIRGAGSITAGSDPLYVIDGVIAGAGASFDVNMLNPRDIESITVLKDASATSLYGSRASNGVIVITTKQAQPGTSNIDISTTLGVNNRTNGNFEVMNSAQNYEYHDLMGNPNLDSSWQDRDTDWQDLAFDQGVTQEYQVSVSAGNDRTRYYISGNYYNEEGTLISDELERFSGRLNLTHQVNDRLNLITSLSGSYTNNINNPTGALYQSYTNMPWDEPYREDGTIRTGNESSWLGRDNSNFLYPLQYNWNQNRRHYMAGSVRAEYDIFDWLYVSSTNRATMNAFRAESNAKLGNDQEAIDDVNVIRQRAGLNGNALYTVGDLKGRDSVLDVVLEERRLELAFEAHRKLDIFRNDRDLVRDYPGTHLNPNNPGVDMEKGTQIIPPDHPRVVFFIPENELSLNPNLEQNP